MKKKQIFCIGWNIIIYAGILAAFIVLNLMFNGTLKTDLKTVDNGKVQYITWIVIESFTLLILGMLYVIGSTLAFQDVTHWKEKIEYSVITLNILWLINIIIEAKHKGLLINRHLKWKTFDLIIMACAIAIYMILATIDNVVLPSLPPLWVSLSLQYVAIFFVAWITQSFLKTLLTGFLCGIFLLALPTTYFLNFIQFCFDYLFDNMAIAFASFVIIKDKDKSILRWMSFQTIPFILIFWSRVIAGVAFYGDELNGYNGFPMLLGSMFVNSFNTGFDYLVMIIVCPIIFSSLGILKRKYNERNKTRKA